MIPPPPDVPTAYELRVHGHLDHHWSTWFDGFTLTHHDDGTTTLRGRVRDQAELHGVLVKVRDLGTTLVSVRLVCRESEEHAADEPRRGLPQVTPQTGQPGAAGQQLVAEPDSRQPMPGATR